MYKGSLMTPCVSVSSVKKLTTQLRNMMAHLASALLAVCTALAVPVLADSLADVEHVILFMQENRAFDHYFGSMAGVRGFSDPNVQVNAGGKEVWFQDVNTQLTNATDFLAPWYLNYLGGFWLNATQCMDAGDNGWSSNHAAINGDLNNHWATNNTPWSWGHYVRSDLPVQYALADGWTVGDMYQVSKFRFKFTRIALCRPGCYYLLHIPLPLPFVQSLSFSPYHLPTGSLSYIARA